MSTFRQSLHRTDIVMNHNSQGPDWAASLVASIKRADEALDAEGFLQLLDEDVIFRLGSQSSVLGKNAVRGVVRQLFAMLNGLRHDVKRLLTDRNTVIFEAEVTYELKRGPSLTLPYVDVLTVGANDLISDYRIYIDLAPMMAAVS